MATQLGMFTNEGDLALAKKLTEALNAMPSSLTVDEQFSQIVYHCKQDLDFCEKHSEWQDTAVREAIYSWLEAPEAMMETEAVGTIDFGATIHITVPTLDGDADAVLSERLDEITDIIQEAIEGAMDKLDRRVGDASRHEWSGVRIRII